jgi:Zn-dependent M28 family amino/carboxypeptidase
MTASELRRYTEEVIRVIFVAALACTIQAQGPEAFRIRAHTNFLASDLLEGRGVGIRGGQLATEYLATQLELAGAKPGGENGTYFQRVPLVGIETDSAAQLSASAPGGMVNFRWLDDFVGVSPNQQAQTEFEAEALFVGHGIVAPEHKWNDYKGADVKGKVLVLFTNEPTSHPDLFGGRALTYYGRWTYKYEEALRQGARGAIIIHTTPTAGYGWEVVRSSWGREEPYVKRAAGQAALDFTGWVTQEAGEQLLGLANRSLDELLKASESPDFRPVPLGVRIRARIPSKIREIETRNVVGTVPGSDSRLAQEYVIFTAHWDHLGVGRPVNGDAIYNGAIDNATGCAIVLELARAWAALPQKPRRSAMFLFVTAEEGGLRGSEYYARNPLALPGKTALNLNYDAIYPFGQTNDIVVAGAERTTFWPVVEQIAQRMNLKISPDPRPEQGSYYRSDHFPLARVGIPAFSVRGGSEFAGKPSGYGDQIFQEFNTKHYHQPSDEFRDEWDFSGLEKVARFGMLTGLEAANQERLPTWKRGDEFLPARQKSGVR